MNAQDDRNDRNQQNKDQNMNETENLNDSRTSGRRNEEASDRSDQETMGQDES